MCRVCLFVSCVCVCVCMCGLLSLLCWFRQRLVEGMAAAQAQRHVHEEQYEHALRLAELHAKTDRAALQRVWEALVGTTPSLPEGSQHAMNQLLAVIAQRDDHDEQLQQRVSSLRDAAEVRVLVLLFSAPPPHPFNFFVCCLL